MPNVCENIAKAISKLDRALFNINECQDILCANLEFEKANNVLPKIEDRIS